MKALNVSDRDRRVFRQALLVARCGDHRRVRVGAVLTKGHRTIASSANRAGLVDGEPWYEGHAERRAIDGQAAMRGTLYVARLDLAGQTVASWPCDECMIYIRSCACVRKIVYHDGHEIQKVRL